MNLLLKHREIQRMLPKYWGPFCRRMLTFVEAALVLVQLSLQVALQVLTTLGCNLLLRVRSTEGHSATNNYCFCDVVVFTIYFLDFSFINISIYVRNSIALSIDSLLIVFSISDWPTS